MSYVFTVAVTFVLTILLMNKLDKRHEAEQARIDAEIDRLHK